MPSEGSLQRRASRRGMDSPDPRPDEDTAHHGHTGDGETQFEHRESCEERRPPQTGVERVGMNPLDFYYVLFSGNAGYKYSKTH